MVLVGSAMITLLQYFMAETIRLGCSAVFCQQAVIPACVEYLR